jgi:hypothetical protein
VAVGADGVSLGGAGVSVAVANAAMTVCWGAVLQAESPAHIKHTVSTIVSNLVFIRSSSIVNALSKILWMIGNLRVRQHNAKGQDKFPHRRKIQEVYTLAALHVLDVA